jgi:RHS repeat-associated protein
VGLTRTSGGTFRLNFGGETTEPIAYNATTAAIESALEALSTIDNVAVGGSPGAYTVTFQGTQSATDVEPLTVEAAGLTNGSIERMLTYGYDAASQLILAEDPAARYTYQYDGLGRLASQSQEIAGLTPLIEYQSQFDLAGNRTELTALLGGSVDFQNTYTYDDLHRLTSLQQQAGGSGPGANAVAEKRVDFSYNAASQITQLTRYADTSGLEFVAHTFYDYDGIGRLTKLLHTEEGSLPGSGWGTDPLAGYAYAYDAASRITSIDSLLDGLTEYDHDDTNQLVEVDHTGISDENYAYDANGNRTGGGYSTGDNNQLLSDGTYNYTYDDEGNRLTRTKIAGGYVTRYEWDHRNRLIAVIEEDDEENVLTTVEHSYDPFNRWVRRVVDADGPGGDPAEETFFSWEADQINLEFAGDDATDLSQRYLSNPAAIDQILAVEEVDSLLSAGDVTWPLTDHLGTPRDLASYDSGTNETTLENHRVFDTFGNLVSQTNGSFTVAIGFTGVHFDAATGLNYHRNRWYDMRVGQWISEDPIGFLGFDGNLRRYVHNGVIRYYDPLGLIDWNSLEPVPWYDDNWTDYVNPIAYGASLGKEIGQGWGTGVAWFTGYAAWDFSSKRQEMILRQLSHDRGHVEDFHKERIRGIRESADEIEEMAEGAVAATELATVCVEVVGTGGQVLAAKRAARASARAASKAALTSGQARVAKFGRNWIKAKLKDAIEQHAGPNATSWRTKSGKTIYENPATGRQVIVDDAGYFRIFNPTA